jgi:hypothetical protein
MSVPTEKDVINPSKPADPTTTPVSSRDATALGGPLLAVELSRQIGSRQSTLDEKSSPLNVARRLHEKVGVANSQFNWRR